MAFILHTIKLYSALKVSGVTYTENGVHRCVPSPTPSSDTLVCNLVDEPEDNTFVPITLRPKNGQVFSRIEIPAPYYFVGSTRYEYDLMNPGIKQPCFMTFEMRDKQNTFNTIYCWIDSITPKIEKATRSSYIIDFHVDWWLTAGNQATFGTGRMLRGPSSYARPDPSEPRLWENSGNNIKIFNDATGIPNSVSYLLWAIVLYTVSGNGYTVFEIATWPINYSTEYNGDTYKTLDVERMYEGVLEEILGIAASSIVGCWISPMNPIKASDMDGVLNKWRYETTSDGEIPRACWIQCRKFGTPNSIGLSGFGTLKSSDSEKYVVIDPQGGIAATVPWGLEFKRIDLTVDVGTTGAQLCIYFSNGAYGIFGSGRMVTIPLISIPITSNAVTDYVYSGEREYDKSMRLIQQQQALVSGITGAGTSAIGGAIAGGNVSTAAAGAGAVAGAAAAVGGSIINYYATGHFDRKTQEAVDRYKSNQIASVISASNGGSWKSVTGHKYWSLQKLTRDSVSAAELTTEQSELGYLTDTQVADCSTLIAAKGPLKIEGLEVSGLLPEGNRYISQMFARGVHLD